MKEAEKDEAEEKEAEEEQEDAPAVTSNGGGGGGIFGWFTGASAVVKEELPAEEAPPPVEEPQASEGPSTVETPPSPAAAAKDTTHDEEEDGVIVDKQEAAAVADDHTAKEEGGEEEKEPATTPAAPPKREMTEEEQQQLDDAFRHSTPSSAAAADAAAAPPKNNVPDAAAPGRLTVSPDTPVPHADICLKLLRKFAHKTRPKILTQYGGSLHRSLLSYLFAKSSDQHQQDVTFGAYRTLLDIVFDADEDRSPPVDPQELSERLARSLNSRDNDDADHDPPVDAATTARANAAVAAFCDLVATWGHASSALLEKAGKDSKGQQAFADLQVAVLDAASNLVAYGCLDHVLIAVVVNGPNNNGSNNMRPVRSRRRITRPTTTTKEQKPQPQPEYLVAAQMLAQSVFNCDLSLERVELAAMKFLLGTGCRQNPSLLRGSHLLQTIRTLYHVYLTTESKSNKTTARAALQQLVTSVFTKVVDHHAGADGAVWWCLAAAAATGVTGVVHRHPREQSVSVGRPPRRLFGAALDLQTVHASPPG